MKDLREKLLELPALGPKRGSRERGERARSTPLESVLPGRTSRTRSGEHFLVSSEEPLETRFDLHSALAGDALALLAGQPQVAEIPPQRWLFLDTETTGLAGGTGTYAFLVGLAQCANGNFRVDQHFMRHYGEERSLLEPVAERLAEAGLLITFNGKAFDLPLLETRFQLARFRLRLDHLAHLDLLYPARQLWRLRLGSVRLIELERRVLAVERDGDVPGELIPQIYFDYLRRSDPLPLVDVFRHNRYDLRALAAVLERLLQAVTEPRSVATEPLDLFGLSRLLEVRRQVERSRELYERSLALGLPSSLEPTALRRLAALSKGTGDRQRAAELWQRWSECDVVAVQPEIELAIYHEHHTRDYAAALEATGRALARLNRAAASAAISRDSLGRHRELLQHRLARLERKQSRSLQTILEND